jgi:hypothetical protein
MDERDEAGTQADPPEAGRREPGASVGLGRVVENPAGLGEASGQGTAGDPDTASQDSFPASDPPGFMAEPATPRDPGRTELPEPGTGP